MNHILTKTGMFALFLLTVQNLEVPFLGSLFRVTRKSGHADLGCIQALGMTVYGRQAESFLIFLVVLPTSKPYCCVYLSFGKLSIFGQKQAYLCVSCDTV